MIILIDIVFGDRKNGSMCRVREKARLLRGPLPSYVRKKEFGVQPVPL
jgi:hypothetical protein